MNLSTAGILDAAAESIRIRAEVESVLSCALTDVEYTLHLQSELERHNQVTRLQDRLQTSSAALDEYQSFRSKEIASRQELGDLFVGELLLLSLKLGDLELWKAENEAKVKQVNDLEDKLARSEEMVRNMQRNRSLNVNWDKDLAITNHEASLHGDTHAPDPDPASPIPYDSQHQPSDTQPQQPQPNHLLEQSTMEQYPTNSRSRNESSGPDAAAGETLTTTINVSHQPTTTYDQDESFLDKPSLQTIDEATLMNLFEYLDALDILNISLVNITLYSKIDALFGLSSAVTSSKPSQNHATMPSNDVDAAATTATDDDPKANNHMSYKSTSHSHQTETKTKTTTASTTTTKTVDTSSDIHTKSDIHSTTTTTTTTAASSSASDGKSILMKPSIMTNVRVGNLPNVFNLLKTKTDDVDESSSSMNLFHKKSTTPSSSSAAAAAGAGGAEMTPSMATSLSDKLSPAELSAIISMKSQLEAKIKELDRLKIEKEDLAARLESTESVKDFLINKVRDTEKDLKQSKEECAKISQTVSSDQEVIAFLDSRVQQLEGSIKGFEEAKDKALKSREQMKVESDKKLEVLSDMLQLEREQLSAKDKEWKSTKKVLVKEVKHCRAQILTLQAERDSFHQQNKQLKDALHSLSNSSSSSFNYIK